MYKFLSVITNFGCHYTCPYCIVKNNNLKIPKTTLAGLDCLANAIENNRCNCVSFSGGGDPLFNWREHTDWWDKALAICFRYNCWTELHTSYFNEYPYFCSAFNRIVFHCRSISDLYKIYHRDRHQYNRAVFVVTSDMTEEDVTAIADYVENSDDIDELSFRQLVDDHYETKYYLHDFLKAGHKKRWYYIEQNDYNVYYAENRVAYRYRDICLE